MILLRDTRMVLQELLQGALGKTFVIHLVNQLSAGGTGSPIPDRLVLLGDREGKVVA
jgi:hypothetical protein